MQDHARMVHQAALIVVGLVLYGCGPSPLPGTEAMDMIRRAQGRGGFHGAASVATLESEPQRLFAGFETEPDGKPISDSSRFRLASLTKVFTQVALLRLMDAGRLRLDDPLAAHRPGFDAAWARTVTLRDLLAFRSGLPREYGEDAQHSGVVYDERGYATPFLNTLTLVGPDVEPGSRTQYSNLGYMHLGAVIETVTGQPFADAVEELVVKPAALQDTGFGVNVLGEDGHVRGHEVADGGFRVLEQYAVSPRYATGGMYGSLRDLERLSAAILDGELLSDSATDALFTQFGRPDDADPTAFHATGYVPGFANAWMLSRQPRFAIILLTNATNTSPRSVVEILRTASQPFAAREAAGTTPGPPADEGWIKIGSLDEVPPLPALPGIRAYLDAVASGELEQAIEAFAALQGFERATMSDNDRADLRRNATYEQDVFHRYGPFAVSAWREGKNRSLELYLDGPEGRALRYRFEPVADNPTVIHEKAHATIGFAPQAPDTPDGE